MAIITPDDVATWTSGWSDDDLALLVDGLNAKALRVAPCLGQDPSAEVLAEARLLLVGAIKRWSEAGSGAFSQQTAGPFSASIDTRQRAGGYNLWPNEITALQDLCSDGASSDRAYSVTPAKAGSAGYHWPWCDWPMFGLKCSCGAALTRSDPLWERGVGPDVV